MCWYLQQSAVCSWREAPGPLLLYGSALHLLKSAVCMYREKSPMKALWSASHALLQPCEEEINLRIKTRHIRPLGPTWTKTQRNAANHRNVCEVNATRSQQDKRRAQMFSIELALEHLLSEKAAPELNSNEIIKDFCGEEGERFPSAQMSRTLQSRNKWMFWLSFMLKGQGLTGVIQKVYLKYRLTQEPIKPSFTKHAHRFCCRSIN